MPVSLILMLLQGRVSYADWSSSGWHPRTFAAKDISPSLVQRMRGGGQLAAVLTATAPDAATPTVDAETAAATAAAVEATIAEAEAEVAAARAAAAAAAQQQEPAGAYDEADEPPLPTCEVAGAIHSASTLLFQPLGVVRQSIVQPDSADSAVKGVVPAEPIGGTLWVVDAGYVPLGSHCALFARKFTAGVVNEALAMALSCAGVGLGSWCYDQQGLAGTG
jgi:hypothetical protein